MTPSQPVRAETCDVCIVGAGIAGLNALFAASRYLSRDQKVILIDRRARVGGMWVDVYSYVRLHQPHPMFTAGNIEWTLGKDRAYLATKGEVLDHLQHCVDVISEGVQVDEYFGWDFESEEEANGIVRVTSRAADGRVLRRPVRAPGGDARGLGPRDQARRHCGRADEEPPERGDVAKALDLTGFFLERHVLAPHGRALPAARSRLVDRLRA